MQAIILAAGKGTRLGDLGKEIPKCLIKIGEKTLLEEKINAFRLLGVTDLLTVIGKNGECWTENNISQIEKTAGKILINDINDTTSNSYSARLAINTIEPDDTIIIDGDLAISFKLIKSLVEFPKSVILSKESFNREEKRNKILSDDENRVLEMAKDISFERLKFPYHVYGACMKIAKKDFETFKRVINKEEYVLKNTDFLVNELAKLVEVYHLSSEEWANINKPEELDAAKKYFESGLNELEDKKFIAFMSGYTGVGKSTAALKIADLPNTKIFHSAQVRKELDLTPKDIEEADKLFDYRNNLREDMDKTVYSNLAEKAERAISSGHNAVIDAGFFFRWQRKLVYDIAKKQNASVFMVIVKCDNEEEIKKRLSERGEKFDSSVLNETPSWNTYLATKEITEPLNEDEKNSVRVIEYDSTNGKVVFTEGPHALNIIGALRK